MAQDKDLKVRGKLFMTLPILDDAEHPDGVDMGVSVNLGSYSHSGTPH